MSDKPLDFRSKFDYICSLHQRYGLEPDEANELLWILEMWDRKQELPVPTNFKLNSLNNDN